ncbi:LCP family protein [Actinomadura sp. HBU206391]|uniref:LCP family protein n=1 Tax=Actinomadura sp. HBU206391 TaxID=2731692 RepID=UPI00164F3182|nr:LCP family protein [Actinomadura sp. HBU206391]MBC6457301.1 LCP family protein [Actinomadura sp. HBU206391]
MDELTMVGEVLAQERPASAQVTAHARGRLLDEIGTRRRFALRQRSWRTWAALALVSGVTAALAVAPTVLLGGDHSVQAPPGTRPVKQDKALNVLVVGSDRSHGVSGARADTMILLHLSADRKSLRGVSLPRDLMVRIPACESPEGAALRGRLDLLGSAFLTGGLTCAWKTVESVTGVHVDHAMEIDYSGFKSMVNALGGVEIRLPRAVDDRYSGLRLPAGRQIVDGEQALAYVRARRGIEDGSDLARVKNQQRFLAAMLARAGDRLTDPARLYSFLQAVDRSVTTDPGLDLKTMYAIARGAKVTGPGGATFVTVPVRVYPPDPNRIQLNGPAAERLFARLR